MRILHLTVICFSSFFLMGAATKTVSIEKLSLEEKVGQMLLAHFNGITTNAESNKLVCEAHVGGIIYYSFSNPFEDPYQVQALSIELQNTAKRNKNFIPLFIAADQEGGRVNRLEKGFTLFPSQRAIAETNDPENAKNCAFATAKELKAVGINMNLAPVVDVTSSEKASSIGIRSYGSDPKTVSLFAKAALDGYKEAGIIAVLKHFPGLGSSEIDSHDALPLLKKQKSALETSDLAPFKSLKDAADVIMTAHILLPQIDAKYCATLSKTILTDVLREEMGYTGLVISDSLNMDGLLENLPDVKEAALQALLAGCDLLILGGKILNGEKAGQELTPNDVIAIHAHLVKAVKENILPESVVNARVEKILSLKEKHHLFTESYPKKEAISSHVNSKEHQVLAQSISKSTVKLVKNALKASFQEKSFESPLIVAHESMQSSLVDSDLFTLGKNTKVFYYKSLDPTDGDILDACKLAKSSSCIIFCTANAWQHKSQQVFEELLKESNKPLISLASLDAEDSAVLQNSDLLFTTLSPTLSSFNEVVRQIKQLEKKKSK